MKNGTTPYEPTPEEIRNTDDPQVKHFPHQVMHGARDMTQFAWSDSCLAQFSVRTQQYQEAAALALTHVDLEGAGRQASRLIERQNAAEELGPLAGLSCTIQACFDVEG